VKDRYATYDQLKGIWADAQKVVERLDRFETAQELQNINTRLADPSIQNKTAFDKERTKVSAVLPEVTRGEGLRTRAMPDTESPLRTYISDLDAYLKESKPAYPYFKRLEEDLTKLQAQARSGLTDLASRNQEKQRLVDLKTSVGVFAKAAGVDVFDQKNSPVRGMKRATATKYLAQLASIRVELLALLTKIEPGTDRAAVEKQLDRINSRLKGFEDTGD
jgi:hypothetical protein